MQQGMQQLDKELVKAHKRLEKVTNYVEKLEGMKGFVLREKRINNPGPPRLKAEQPGKEQNMILFEKDCSKRFSISQDILTSLKQDLVMIVGQTKILDSWEPRLSTEGKKELKVIEIHALHVGQILEGLKENGNES